MAVIFFLIFFEKGVDILYAKAYNMDVLKKSTKKHIIEREFQQ